MLIVRKNGHSSSSPNPILLDFNREAAESAAVRRRPRDKRRPSAPSEGQ